MVALVRILAAAVAVAFLAPSAFACAKYPTGSGKVITPQDISHDMFSLAVLAAVNDVPCERGLDMLGPGPVGLRQVALSHSVWMAGSEKLSHRGRSSAGRSFEQRLRASGASIAHASENIAFLPRFRFGGAPFRIASGRDCRFLSESGNTIPAHTYASIARELVELWMESPPHRRNILDQRAESMVAAAAFSSDRTCGKFWVTQVFTG